MGIAGLTGEDFGVVGLQLELQKGKEMRLLIALILPWLAFLTIGRPVAGVICLILQLTLIGWLPATIWAVYALGQYKTDKKIEKAISQRA